MGVDWEKSDHDERRALYRVTKAILDREGITWPDFFEKHLRPPLNRGPTYASDNFVKGRVSWKIAHQIAGWITANHLEFAAQYDPALFDATHRTEWQVFLDAGQYGAAHVVLPKNGRNLVQRADDHPIFEQPIKLGQTFFFLLRNHVPGSILAFEEYQGEWHPFPVGPDMVNLAVASMVGKQPLPLNPTTGQPLLLRELDHSGKHGYAFIIGPSGLIEHWESRLVPGRPVSSDILNDLARALSDAGADEVAVYRLNVLFTNG